MNRLLALWLVPVLLVAAGCTTPAGSAASLPSDGNADFVLVTLKTGPRSSELSAAEQTDIFTGHMANMQRLAAERKLLIAGPYGEVKHDANLRGIFVFDVPTVELALALSETDPGVQSGVFAVECRPLRASVVLRQAYDFDREDKETRVRENLPSGNGEAIRGYVMLTAHDAPRADAALAELAAQGAVIWSGRLGGDREEQAVYVLDAEDVAAARQMLGPALDQLGDCWIEEWWSTRSLERLASVKATSN